MQAQREKTQGEEAERQEEEEALESLEGERDWFQSVGPQPGPGNSDGGGSD